MLKKQDILLYEGLIEKGLISREALEPYIKEVEVSDSNLLQVLVDRGIFLEKDLLAILAQRLNMPFLDLKTMQAEKSVLDKIPVKIAAYYKFMPVSIKDRVLTIAVAYPMDIKTQDEIRTQLGYDVDIVLAAHSDITEGLRRYYGSAAETIDKIVSQAPRAEVTSRDVGQEKVEDIEKMAGDASVIKLVNQIILEAYRKRATDIHIEPYRNGVAFRYRIDGILYDANVPADIKGLLNAIISRIKIMSNLNIVERRLPQDGRAIVRVQDQVLDLRISTIPTPYGESVVIRILPTQMLFSLEKLGLPKDELSAFEKLLAKPHGIIFATGPTGSGKTTTLYTCLSKLNTKDRKIITIEDPIEYEMSGITQIQVMPEIGLDFARGLRSILRHDPDVIMVGEVRDLETAEIAIRVALTGHLIFSTLHTNDAASGVTRLIDIGVEPYLVASSVEAFIAQRLIRVICQSCKHEEKSAPREIKEMIAADMGMKPSDVKIYRGKGCANCNHTGFYGRTAIYEILLIDETMKDMILKKVSSSQLKNLAVSRGMRTLRQDGWQKVLAGVTTTEEVLNVTSADESKALERPVSAAFSEEPESASAPTPRQSEVLDEERRLYMRLNKKINLKFKVFKSRDELLKRGFTVEQLSVTKNISASGLLFISDELLPIGSMLEFKIELPDTGEHMEFLARVVRVEELVENKEYDIAACFLDATGAQRNKLNRYVEQEARRYGTV